MMRKFIYTTFLFVITSILMYMVLILVWGLWMPKVFKPNLINDTDAGGFMNNRFVDLKNYSQIDILFLGSSHAYRGFDTRIFETENYQTFNLGSFSQSPMQTQLLLKRHLEKLQPQLVVYEVYPETFNYDGLESAIDLLDSGPIDAHSLRMAFQLNHIKAYNALNYSFLSQKLGLKKNSYANYQGVDTYIQGGYVARAIQFAPADSFRTEEIKLGDKQLTFFRENIKMIQDQGAEILLVFAPIPVQKYKKLQGRKEFDSTMQTLATYIDFNSLLSLNDTVYFYDDNHLNQNGVDTFNHLLIREINRLLPNLRKQ